MSARPRPSPGLRCEAVAAVLYCMTVGPVWSHAPLCVERDRVGPTRCVRRQNQPAFALAARRAAIRACAFDRAHRGAGPVR